MQPPLTVARTDALRAGPCAVMLSIIASMCMAGMNEATAAESGEDFVVRCGVRFVSPTQAELRWETNLEGKGSVAFGPSRKLGTILRSPNSGTSHRVVLEPLDSDQVYYYRIAVDHDGKRYFSDFHEFDAGINYSPPLMPSPGDVPSGIDAVISQLDQPGGYAVVSGSLARVWAQALAAQTSMTIVAACVDEGQRDELRREWLEDEIYGIRLTSQLIEDVPHDIANLVFSDADSNESMREFLSPTGLIACVGRPSASPGTRWTQASDDLWFGRSDESKPLANWSHQYGSSSNTSYSGETLGGLDDTSDLEIRWLGRPGADFGIDRNPRMPAPLAVGGRLFHQGMNRMIALDSFNGAVLWSLEMPALRRVNIPRDCSNWCADEEHVYVAAGDCLWVIDAATGEMKHTMLLPDPEGDRGSESDGAGDQFEWGYVATTDDMILGTTVRAGSAYEQFWSKPSWYDGMDDNTTAKVCGRAIVAYGKEYGDVRWSRDVDAVVQSTITINDDRMFFVEMENPELRGLDTGQLSNKQLATGSKVVCLDLKTGEELWSQSTPPFAENQVVAFGLADDDQFILETSSDGEFQFASFDRRSGKSRWTRTAKWSSDNHGAHMQHAVLMNGKLFVQPHILDAASGSVLKSDTLGKRRGCATPVGAGNSIIYRGGKGPVSLWSLEKEEPSEFTRLRPSCWLSTIPAQGMLFSPEAGGGCSCGGWMECSIGFAPRRTTLTADE